LSDLPREWECNRSSQDNLAAFLYLLLWKIELK
jgi:hypothetical protein